MADKTNRLIRDALSRAATEPEGCALFGSKSEAGLFPPTALAKSAAERCKNDGYLHVVRTENKGKLSRELCALTEKGRHFLLEQGDAREVLEDFVRVLESRQEEVSRLTESVKQMQQSLNGIHSAVGQILPRLADTPSRVNAKSQPGENMNGPALMNAPATFSIASDDLIVELKAKLAEWHEAAGASEDCPLPELYRRMEMASRSSVGQFHDALRQLHDDRMIYLHPWTGPLYALPQPTFALLVGHEIAYYASIR